jgi:hypothetical protein
MDTPSVFVKPLMLVPRNAIVRVGIPNIVAIKLMRLFSFRSRSDSASATRLSCSARSLLETVQKKVAHMGFKVKEIAERLIIQCFIDVFS